MLEVAHLGAFVDCGIATGLVVDGAASSGDGGNDEGCGTSSIHFPVGERRVGLRVVRLPERTRVGRDREAADLRIVPDQPRCDDDTGRGDDEHGGDELAPRREDARRTRRGRSAARQSRELPRIATPQSAPSSTGRASRAAPYGEQRDEHDPGERDLVGDLAVDVDVVPDQVRVAASRPRRPRRRGAGRRAARRSRRGRRSPPRGRSAARPTTSQERPKHPVERDEEQAVERLRGRRRMPGDEPERAGRDERLREVVALLGVRREDRPALEHQHREPRQDGGGDDGGECGVCLAAKMRTWTSLKRYAVVSCHVERPLDDAVWRAFERLLDRRPAGFVVTPLAPAAASPPPGRTRSSGSSGRGAPPSWRRSATTRTGAARRRHARRARSTPAAFVRDEAEWLRARDLAPRYFCGGGWYLDEPLAEVLASFGYVDCTATTFRQQLSRRRTAPRLQLPGPAAAAPPKRRRAARAAGDPLARDARARTASASTGSCTCTSTTGSSSTAAARSRSRRSCALLRLRRRPLSVDRARRARRPARRCSTGTRLRSPRESTSRPAEDVRAVPPVSPVVLADQDVAAPAREHRGARGDRHRRPRDRPLRRARPALARLRPEADPLGPPLGSRDVLARVPHPAARARLLAGRACTRRASCARARAASCRACSSSPRSRSRSRSAPGSTSRPSASTSSARSSSRR